MSTLPKPLADFIEKETNPPYHQTLQKLFLIQGFSILLLLSFCPQWGIGFWDSGVKDILMTLGHFWCETICGALYSVVFVGGVLLGMGPFERRKIFKQPLFLLALTLLSGTGYFLLIGLSLRLPLSDIVTQITWMWFLGASAAHLFLTKTFEGREKLAHDNHY
ncbi:MAG: hypothetical protein NZ480_05595 [Bdellovibrionaceae bacterium]|nr:hypothetical protein [Pseudobdellovibrionaceae bacterium]MDW8190509.1 hypothetical protein [Pseudobdellovibrionaceae bacterium]